jgi:integrative and conjugative element protein (TIGR02256 family)
MLTLELPNGAIVLIDLTVLRCIKKYLQSKPADKEAGGILIGEYYYGNHLHITDCTEPSTEDDRGRFSFHRKSPHHQELTRKLWSKSGKTKTWIGEWHTHPEDTPNPSTIDINNWQKNLPKRQAILLIQGNSYMWIGYWNGLQVRFIAHHINKNE